MQTTDIFDHQREGKAARKRNSRHARHQARTRRLAHLVIRSTGKNQTFFLVKILLRFLKAVAPFFIAEIVAREPIPLIGKVCLRRWGKSAQVPAIIAEKWRFCTVRMEKIKQKNSDEKNKNYWLGRHFRSNFDFLCVCAFSCIFAGGPFVGKSSNCATACGNVRPGHAKQKLFPSGWYFLLKTALHKLSPA